MVKLSLLEWKCPPTWEKKILTFKIISEDKHLTKENGSQGPKKKSFLKKWKYRVYSKCLTDARYIYSEISLGRWRGDLGSVVKSLSSLWLTEGVMPRQACPTFAPIFCWSRLVHICSQLSALGRASTALLKLHDQISLGRKRFIYYRL